MLEGHIQEIALLLMAASINPLDERKWSLLVLCPQPGHSLELARSMQDQYCSIATLVELELLLFS